MSGRPIPSTDRTTPPLLYDIIGTQTALSVKSLGRLAMLQRMHYYYCFYSIMMTSVEFFNVTKQLLNT